MTRRFLLPADAACLEYAASQRLIAQRVRDGSAKVPNGQHRDRWLSVLERRAEAAVAASRRYIEVREAHVEPDSHVPWSAREPYTAHRRRYSD